MTEVRLRNVEPETVAVLREIARRHAQTMEQYLTDRLTDLANRDKLALLDELRHARDGQRAAGGELSDSTPGIRAEREARW